MGWHRSLKGVGQVRGKGVDYCGLLGRGNGSRLDALAYMEKTLVGSLCHFVSQKKDGKGQISGFPDTPDVQTRTSDWWTVMDRHINACYDSESPLLLPARSSKQLRTKTLYSSLFTSVFSQLAISSSHPYASCIMPHRQRYNRGGFCDETARTHSGGDGEVPFP